MLLWSYGRDGGLLEVAGMETSIGVLEVLGVFVLLPVVVGLAIAASFRPWKRREASRKASMAEMVHSTDADV